ncbi:MAG: peptidyl-prolyl cis-trans isomerase [Gammaproteobacteria bacterium]
MSALLMLPVCATGTVASAADTEPGAAGTEPKATMVDDVIARVGDQTITFSEISTALNSSAIVGLSIPALGTPKRDTTRIVLLDRFVSANLLYLDALKQGVDKDPDYQRAITRFSDAILSGLYRQRNQAGDIPISEEEVQTYYKQYVAPDTELTADLRLQIESTLRRQKLHERLATAEKTLRDDVRVVIHPENLALEDDENRADSTPLAEVGTETITWGQVSDRIIAAGKGTMMTDPSASEDQARRDALEYQINLRIMVQKARSAGIEEDPLYKRRMTEYQKTLLINRHREQLAKTMEPTPQELKAWYEANKIRFVVPEARKLQMIVVKTREEAGSLKGKIESGELTIYQAARDHSIAAKARQDLGEVGWVNQGEVVPALDQVIFSLGPGEIGGPVETPAGWHLVKVTEVIEAKFTDFSDETTRKQARRKYLHEKMDAYTAELRKHEFPVEVYQERLVQLEQQEADTVKSLAEKAQQPGSVTQKRIEEMQKSMAPPM